MNKLNIILMILIVGTISIFDDLNTNIFGSKTLFHIIWALLNNLISLQLIFQSPLSLGFRLPIKALLFIVLAISLIIISNYISIIVILNNEINWNHWWEDAMFWWIRNLTFALGKCFHLFFIYLHLLIKICVSEFLVYRSFS